MIHLWNTHYIKAESIYEVKVVRIGPKIARLRVVVIHDADGIRQELTHDFDGNDAEIDANDASYELRTRIKEALL